MPVEYSQLKDQPPALERCPHCGAEPFAHFLRGMIQRAKRSLWGLGPRRPYCAIICARCKDTVGFEMPPRPEEIWP